MEIWWILLLHKWSGISLGNVQNTVHNVDLHSFHGIALLVTEMIKKWPKRIFSQLVSEKATLRSDK